MQNKNKNKIEAYKHFWPDLNGKCKKGWCLHHIDPSWKHNDRQRYNEWNIDDLIPMKISDHIAYHNHFIDRKGENNPMYGRSIKDCMSEESYTQHLIHKSISLKKYYETHDGHMKGKHHTLEAKQKMSNSWKKYYETHDYSDYAQRIEHLKEFWKSEVGMLKRKEISTKYSGENNPMYGRSIKDCMSEEEYKTWRQNIAAANKKSAEKRKKPILQFDKNGNFIREWPSMTDARNAGYKGHIIDVCHGYRKYACGYIWRFKLSEKTKTQIEPKLVQ